MGVSIGRRLETRTREYRQRRVFRKSFIGQSQSAQQINTALRGRNQLLMNTKGAQTGFDRQGTLSSNRITVSDPNF
jgi:hypothetical protein